MGAVTALRATRRGGVALHVDGQYVCTISESAVARWRLFKGRELDDETLAAIRTQASAERVAADAYRLLGHRARSRAELRRRLLQKGHDEVAVAATLERLAADGHIDDAAFARSYVADKRRLAGWGVERIRRGLLGLGVSAADADAALTAGDAGAEEGLELARALEVLERLGAPRPPLEAARGRAYQTLLRRGYGTAVAYAAVMRWSGAAPGAGDDPPGAAPN
jgi:regulatory protein